MSEQEDALRQTALQQLAWEAAQEREAALADLLKKAIAQRDALKAACLAAYPLLAESAAGDDSGPAAAEVVEAYHKVRAALEMAGEDVSDE